MEVDVEAVLASKKVQTRTTEVAKDVELHYDLGNMLATDLNALDTQALRCVRACVRVCVCWLSVTCINDVAYHYHMFPWCLRVLMLCY